MKVTAAWWGVQLVAENQEEVATLRDLGRILKPADAGIRVTEKGEDLAGEKEPAADLTLEILIP